MISLLIHGFFWDFTNHRMIVSINVSEHPIGPIIFDGQAVHGCRKSQRSQIYLHHGESQKLRFLCYLKGKRN